MNLRERLDKLTHSGTNQYAFMVARETLDAVEAEMERLDCFAHPVRWPTAIANGLRYAASLQRAAETTPEG